MTGHILMLYRTRVLHFVLMLALIALLEAIGSLAPQTRGKDAVSAGLGYEELLVAQPDADVPEGGATLQDCAQPAPGPRHVMGLFAPAVMALLEVLPLRQDR